MKETPSTLLEMSQPLVDQFNSFCEQYGLIGVVAADHICIRCSSNDIYEKRRRDFEKEATFIFQAYISKRRSSIIRLQNLISTYVGEIAYLELSDQKPDNSQIDCIDHIEMVPTSITYEELVTKLESQNVEIKEVVRPHHTTHDITLPSGFSIRLSREFLIEKIKREEML